MSLTAASPPAKRANPAPFHPQLAGLGRTFEAARQPVWIHDLTDRCVYRNAAAQAAYREGAAVQLHDIVDHEDRKLGYLVIGRS